MPFANSSIVLIDYLFYNNISCIKPYLKCFHRRASHCSNCFTFVRSKSRFDRFVCVYLVLFQPTRVEATNKLNFSTDIVCLHYKFSSDFSLDEGEHLYECMPCTLILAFIYKHAASNGGKRFTTIIIQIYI